MEPAQDEDDLYDLLHDEIAASRSRPRPGGAEDDEEQRQDTKVRATHPHPHHPGPHGRPGGGAQRLRRELGAKTEQCAALQRQVDDLQSQVSPAAAPTALLLRW